MQPSRNKVASRFMGTPLQQFLDTPGSSYRRQGGHTKSTPNEWAVFIARIASWFHAFKRQECKSPASVTWQGEGNATFE